MEFVRLATVDEFKGVRIKSFRVLAKLIAIVRDPDGTFWATEIACKHQNADLATEGRWAGDIVTCSRHFWKYDLRTGRCLNQNSAPLRRHALKRIGNELHVSVQPIEPESPPGPENDDPMPDIVFRRDG